MKKVVQLSFPPTGRGGARPGAGRPRGDRVTHHGRAPVDVRHPLHLVLRIRDGIWNLRSKALFKEIRYALEKVCEREGFRIVHFNVQGNHIHAIVEADSTVHLSRAMQSMCTRIAKRINARMERRGPVFADRFYARSLRTPTQVANAIAYVLENTRRHEARKDFHPPRSMRPEPFTSAELAGCDPPLVSEPKTWLLRVGWMRGRRRTGAAA
ncbi:MAG TPA: transposase [Myxococcales bacterium]|nr:transposase [Myxococcales bacterium]